MGSGAGLGSIQKPTVEVTARYLSVPAWRKVTEHSPTLIIVTSDGRDASLNAQIEGVFDVIVNGKFDETVNPRSIGGSPMITSYGSSQEKDWL